ncbi:MAG: TIGR04086 family membrane protein [Bacilli bacterium]|nr:TIGR04086 family membrane protein [Bacilli bacterium]MDD3304933.1 TIGR04086 family membrane protein [Bacilli bacterium]MDD4411850.1 TIGR04086 family membrane protein [Bacilli bacterium]
MKIYLKALAYMSISILGLILILTIFHYFNLLGDKVVDITKLLIVILSVGVGGYIVGNSALQHGWLEGLKFSGIIIVIFFLLTLIFKLGLSYNTIIYYFIIMGASTIGSMIGINFKEKDSTK